MRLLALIGFSALLLPGCGGGSEGPHRSEPRLLNGLQLRARTDRAAYRLGQPVEITLEITNVGESPAYWEVACDWYDPRIMKDGRLIANALIWRTTDGCNAAVFRREILPGETYELTETWDQKDNNGIPAAPGSYDVEVAHFPFAGPLTPKLTIGILPRLL